MSVALGSIDQLYYTVTRITTHSYTDSMGVSVPEIKKATGFFYENNNKTFLITNRHVIVDEQNDYFRNTVRLLLHTDVNDITQNKNYDIHLRNKLKERWIEPTQQADVVAIPIEGNLLQQGFVIKCFNRINLLSSNIRLHVGEDVFVMGYPLGFN